MGQFDDVTNLSNGWQLTFVLIAQPHMTHCDTVFSFHYITTLNMTYPTQVSSFLVHKHNIQVNKLSLMKDQSEREDHL